MRILKILSTTSTITLLAKNNKLFRSGLAILLIPIFFACDDPSLLGLELDNENSQVGLRFLELTLPAEVVSVDSLRTDNLQNVIFGNYQDSIVGGLRAISYGQYNLNGGQLPDDTLSFSKAYLSLRVDGIKADQILQSETLTIYEAEDTLFSSPAYLSSTSTPYNTTKVIGTSTFIFNPSVDTMVNVSLSDSFGRSLFNKLKRLSDSDEYKDSLLLGLYHYPPFVFEPGAGNQGLFSFDFNDDTTAIYIEMKSITGRLYYFTFDFRDAHYTQLFRDYSTSKFTDLTTEYTPSTATSSRVYLNPLAGIHPKLSLQPLLDFADTSGTLIINKAEISLSVVPQTLAYVKVLSPLRFYFIKNNKIGGEGTTTTSVFNTILPENYYVSSAYNCFFSNSSGVNPLTVNVNDATDLFKADLTQFCQLIKDGCFEDIFDGDLLIYTPNTTSIHQTSFLKSEIKLKLYYTILK